ncbi:MAG TPA: isocitrate lyase/phosphoenolpyruvate mutase family protein [Bryobacteraceae bacterium]|nr:isocitrate lyase/phosphoenolpyruvate mutase family protein [Bryobacteraceae bacterium]
MTTQAEKGAAFHALHRRAGAFLIPNPWDMGSARVLAHLGFEALATTSSGFAFTLGKPDGAVSRAAMLAHVAAMVSAVDLPVSADLENGYGDAPEDAAETIRLGAAAGLAGGSIEDSTRGATQPVYETEHAAERIRAAAEAVRALPFRFTLTARAENYIVGRPDLADTIRRLQAYQEAGADVLYAPGLTSRNEIAEVIRSVDRPLNVLGGLGPAPLSLAELSAIGVKRVSTGGWLARAAQGAFLRAARELWERGTFGFTKDTPAAREVNPLLEG